MTDFLLSDLHTSKIFRLLYHKQNQKIKFRFTLFRITHREKLTFNYLSSSIKFMSTSLIFIDLLYRDTSNLLLSGKSLKRTPTQGILQE